MAASSDADERPRAPSQDVYAYVTKGKGILGSGGQYNKQQRKMCMPFFQTAPILERYSQVVVDRCDRKRSFTSPMARLPGR
jgi:hypothetical protein